MAEGRVERAGFFQDAERCPRRLPRVKTRGYDLTAPLGLVIVRHRNFTPRRTNYGYGYVRICTDMYGGLVISRHRDFTPSLTNFGNWETDERRTEWDVTEPDKPGAYSSMLISRIRPDREKIPSAQDHAVKTKPDESIQTLFGKGLRNKKAGCGRRRRGAYDCM